MNLPEDAMLLRILIGESDRRQHHPLYEAFVINNLRYQTKPSGQL